MFVLVYVLNTESELNSILSLNSWHSQSSRRHCGGWVVICGTSQYNGMQSALGRYGLTWERPLGEYRKSSEVGEM